MGEMDERRIREVHWPVGVALHKRFEIRQITVIDRKDRNGPRAEQCPSGNELVPIVPDEMEQLGQDGAGCRQWEAECSENIRAGLMPAIVTVEERQEGARVDEAASGHDDERAWP